ncbi:MAG: radical SAM protein [Planctomycetaceae bacterium]|nr:radical SAM protein [Planctomycetaceae bacterium]
MKKRAIVVHLNGIVGVVPLVGGYLKAYAVADPVVRATWDIELFSRHCQVKASEVILELVRREPDLVAFSVYTWNAGLVRRLLPALRGLLPGCHFALGGVEVVDGAHRFAAADWENLIVCNGEGEKSFRQLLLELTEARPNFAGVGGISYAQDGQWHSTAGHPRIQDLTELPSPWLEGAFDGIDGLEVALFETNRGCPFACEFCYWGGAIGQKIYQQETQRLKDELTWIARRGIRAISICDANFGILPRDVELAEHLVAIRRAHGGPERVVFNSSKVKPERVEQISEIFAGAQMLTRHVFSLQSMSPAVLQTAKRTGLDRGPYQEIQRRLNRRRLSSLIELLWPMPGETLDSFQAGVDELMGLGAQTFLIYPLVWLNSTGYSEHTEEYGVIALPEDDSAGGGQLVVRTKEVDFEEYLAGLRFILAVFLLHDCRGLYTTMQVLHATGVARHRDVLSRFVDYMQTEAQGHIAKLWKERMAAFEDMSKYVWRGMLASAVLHSHRKEFDRLLCDFVGRQTDWLSHPNAAPLQAAKEYDLLTRPYVFLQTKCELGVDLEHTELLPSRPRVWHAVLAWDFPTVVESLRAGRGLEETDLAQARHPRRIDHRTNQIFLLPTRSPEEHNWLCTLAVQELARIEPITALLPQSEHEVATAGPN